MEAISTISVAVRILALLLYTGGFMFYAAVLNPKLFRVSPAHRLLVVSETLKRFSYLTWIYIGLMSVGGAIYAFEMGMINSNISSLLQNSNGLVLLIEGALTILMIISAGIMTFSLIPSLSRANVSVVVSSFDARFKWLSLSQGSQAMDALNKIFALAELECRHWCGCNYFGNSGQHRNSVRVESGQSSHYRAANLGINVLARWRAKIS